MLKNVTRAGRFIQDVIRKSIVEELVFPNPHTSILGDEPQQLRWDISSRLWIIHSCTHPIVVVCCETLRLTRGCPITITADRIFSPRHFLVVLEV